jgi:hypothetical protein
MLGGASARLQNQIATWGNYMFVESQHSKNEQLFCNRGKDIMANMVFVGDVVGGERKEVYTIFWLLKQGCPMTNFKEMKLLFFKK